MKRSDLLLVVAAVLIVAGFVLVWYPLGLLAAGLSVAGGWWLFVDEVPE